MSLLVYRNTTNSCVLVLYRELYWIHLFSSCILWIHWFSGFLILLEHHWDLFNWDLENLDIISVTFLVTFLVTEKWWSWTRTYLPTCIPNFNHCRVAKLYLFSTTRKGLSRFFNTSMNCVCIFLLSLAPVLRATMLFSQYIFLLHYGRSCLDYKNCQERKCSEGSKERNYILFRGSGIALWI